MTEPERQPPALVENMLLLRRSNAITAASATSSRWHDYSCLTATVLAFCETPSSQLMCNFYRTSIATTCKPIETTTSNQLRHYSERIERTTHPEALDALPEVWRTHSQQLLGKVQAEIVQALRSVLDDVPFGELHYPDKRERLLTRLGRPTFEIPLAQPMPSPFGVGIHRVAIPSHWLTESQLPDAVRAEPTAGGFRFSIGETAFRYTRFGLEKDDA